MGFKEKYLAKQNDIKSISVRPAFPRIIKIDICNVCNYACVFCPQAKQSDKRGNIDENLCKKVIQDAYEAGARELCLSSTGEPLINPKLEEYIKFAKDLGYEYVFFNTNGYLMTDERINGILTAGIDSIKFSINAGSKELYHLVHGVDGFEKVIDNLKLLCKKKEELKSNCKIYVSFVAIKQTMAEIELLQSKLEPIVDDFVYMNANRRGGSISEIDQGLYVGKDEYSYEYPCSQMFNNLYVSAEGYVNICAQDFENLTVIADLNKMTVEEAWNCDTFVTYRKKYLNGDLENTLCKNCICNTNENVIPLDEEKAYFKDNNLKIENLHYRIEQLSNLR